MGASFLSPPPLPSLSLSIIIEEQLSFLTGWREQKEVAKTKNAGTSKGTKSGIHSSSCFSPLFKLLTPIHKAEEELDGGPLQMDDAKFILDLGENAQSAPVIQWAAILNYLTNGHRSL